MPAVVIDLSATDDPRDVIHRAVQSLAEGKLVVFPTETVYVVAASAQHEAAVARLAAIRRETNPLPPTLALRSPTEIADYVPEITPVAQRLARRCWPGPIILELQDAHADSVVRRLPTSVQQTLTPTGMLRLRVPAHELLARVQRLVSGPLAISAATKEDATEAVTASELLPRLANTVDLVLDSGRCRFAQASSVVRVDDQGVTLQRGGVVSDAHLKRLSAWMAVVVCTGNTCRSPMGEMLLRQRLAERAACRIDELEDRGLVVMSAGLAAGSGGCAADQSVTIMRERGLDLTAHETQPMTDRLVKFADLVLTMTRGHRDTILAQWPDAAGRTFLLSNDRGDVADPIGGPLELYRRCAEQIDSYVVDWVGRLSLPELGTSLK
jgi:protein-tyrosine phosphatase